MTVEAIKDKVKGLVDDIKDVRRVGVFGSYARNEANGDSDIDLVIDYASVNVEDVMSYFELCYKIELAFGENGKDVDIIQYEAITYPENRITREEIERDVIWIYGEEGRQE